MKYQREMNFKWAYSEHETNFYWAYTENLCIWHASDMMAKNLSKPLKVCFESKLLMQKIYEIVDNKDFQIFYVQLVYEFNVIMGTK